MNHTHSNKHILMQRQAITLTDRIHSNAESHTATNELDYTLHLTSTKHCNTFYTHYTLTCVYCLSLCVCAAGLRHTEGDVQDEQGQEVHEGTHTRGQDTLHPEGGRQ